MMPKRQNSFFVHNRLPMESVRAPILSKNISTPISSAFPESDSTFSSSLPSPPLPPTHAHPTPPHTPPQQPTWPPQAPIQPHPPQRCLTCAPDPIATARSRIAATACVPTRAGPAPPTRMSVKSTTGSGCPKLMRAATTATRAPIPVRIRTSLLPRRGEV